MTRTVAWTLAAAFLTLLPARADDPPAKGKAGKPYGWRTPAEADKLAEAGGGTEQSEAAVARGLAWLAKQQRPDGTWVFDGSSKRDVPAATGMALLPFLGAGQTHFAAPGNKHVKTISAGLRALRALQAADGGFTRGGNTMYGHAIAALALCEAYGMTRDRNLRQPAQRAIDFIARAQGIDGSWGYRPGTAGDTSITGWQVQVLAAAKLAQALTVDPRVLARARKFLDTVADGADRSRYGYRPSENPTPSLTAVGLLCRQHLDGWGGDHPGMTAGVAYLLRTAPPPDAGQETDLYYFYYATQVVRGAGGEAWVKGWNPRMRDLLMGRQMADGENAGSFDPIDDKWIGEHCGRLGATAMSVLVLEAYYRAPPPDHPEAVGVLKTPDRKE
jgi:hypothetical protein